MFATNTESFREVFYDKIRSKYLNPVVVIGFEEKAAFVDNFPLFYDHPHNHAYLETPFLLMDLIGLIKDVIPISSQAIRKAISGSDAGYKKYLFKLLSHDLLKSKDECLKILGMASSYIGNEELSAEIKNIIEEIKEKEVGWASIAENEGIRILDRIREGGF